MKTKLTSLFLALAMIFALGAPEAMAATGSMSNFEKTATYVAGTFKDVPANAWYATSMQSCYESGLLYGTTATTFSPSGSLTVAQALVLADRLNSVYYGGDGKLPAATGGAAWYQPAVDYAKAHGILNSTEMPYFPSYTTAVTRGQMAYLLANAMPSSAYAEINSVTTLPDVQISGAFGPQIYLLYRAGVLVGNDCYGTFSANRNISRAAAVSILGRAAFPAQRQTLNLYKAYTAGDTTFGMPADSTRTTYTSTTVVVDNKDQTQRTLVKMNKDSAHKGVSILTMPQETIRTLFASNIADVGVNPQNMTSKAVKFGDTDAYRYVFTVQDASKTAFGCGYVYIYDDTLYVYVALATDNAALKTMANSVTVKGQAVSSAL